MAVTNDLISNWLFIKYEKDSAKKIEKSFKDGIDSPLFNDIGIEKMVGKRFMFPVLSGAESSGSRNLSVGYNGDRQRKDYQEAFVLEKFYKNFSFLEIEREAQMATSQSNIGAYFDEFERKIEEIVAKIRNQILFSIYGRSSFGEIGKVSNRNGINNSQRQVKLSPSLSIDNFEVGQLIEFASVTSGVLQPKKRGRFLSSGRLRNGANTDTLWQISKIDYDANCIFLDGQSDGSDRLEMGNLNNNDLIFREGDYEEASTKFYGLLDFINPPSDVLLGVDTTKDLNRLRGVNLSLQVDNNKDKGHNIYDTIIKAQKQASVKFSKYMTKKMYAHPDVWEELISSSIYKTGVFAMNHNEYQYYSKSDKKNGQGMLISGVKGTVPLFFDTACPRDVILGGCPSVLKLLHRGQELVQFRQQSGSRVIVDQKGKNKDRVYFDSYTALINRLPGCWWSIEV